MWPTTNEELRRMFGPPVASSSAGQQPDAATTSATQPSAQESELKEKFKSFRFHGHKTTEHSNHPADVARTPKQQEEQSQRTMLQLTEEKEALIKRLADELTGETPSTTTANTDGLLKRLEELLAVVSVHLQDKKEETM